MEWLDRIVHSFIMTFGITQPSAKSKRTANIFIGLLLLGMIAVFMGLLAFGVRQITR